jgi:hypothetical protein
MFLSNVQKANDLSVFIEPKGEHLKVHTMKEEFLDEIRENKDYEIPRTLI